MTLPVRRGTTGTPGPRRWTRDPLAEFDDIFGRLSSLLESTVGAATAPWREAWAPLADVSETEDAYLIECDVPGVKRDDLDIEMSGQELIITGELKERERAVVRRSTRRTGHFEYRTMLPSDINAEGIEASLNDGVLTVKVPKAETAKPRHIEITAGD